MTPAEYHDRIQDLGRVVYGMERVGVPIDLEVCREIEKQAGADEVASLARLDELAGTLAGRTETNWAYWKWLAGFLHGDRPGGLGMPASPYCKKGKVKPDKVATDDRALEWLAQQNPEHRPLFKLLQDWRRQRRMKVYARSWIDLAIWHDDGTHRLHPSYGMASDADERVGAKTGRFGIKSPPLQQVPRDKRKDPYGLRRAFVAPRGKKLLVADQSQLELVVLAHICHRLFGATDLRDALLPGAPDLHSATALFVFGSVLGQADIAAAKVEDIKRDFAWKRDAIKAIRYGLNYRKGAWGFGSTLFDENGDAIGEETAQTMIDALLEMHPEIGQFHAWTDNYIAEHRGMHSLMGRWGPFPDGAAREEWKRKRAQRQASNWPMQAGAQEIMMMSMISLHQRGFVQTLQIHDEIHALVDEDKAESAAKVMQETMERTVELDAPLRAEPSAGDSWQGCK